MGASPTARHTETLNKGEQAVTEKSQLRASPTDARRRDAEQQSWDARYLGEEYFYGTEPNGFLAANIDQLGSGRALCLAEGEGRNAVFLAEHGFDVHSVDLSETGVSKTHALARSRGVVVHAQQGDLAVFDLGESNWDVIISIFAHTPAKLRRQLHQRVVSALRPGGAFLLEAYTPAQIGRGTGGPPDASLMMTADALREELAGLQIHHLQEIEREVIEGQGHSGIASVVQCIARR